MKKRLIILVITILTSTVSTAVELKNKVYSIRTVDTDTVFITHKNGSSELATAEKLPIIAGGSSMISSAILGY